ncbi:hypothetical protein L195_g015396 [Trifolium pratense]|uniref:Uncharacterized protein n=1 Tax=Trifolium pratense TaxID=57577 RepID=A0A2K3MN98_TRIPR|nr:hypothetical protein L195_g015396 [Trifolium pratense]
MDSQNPNPNSNQVFPSTPLESDTIVQAPNASQNNDNNAPASEATKDRLQHCVKELVRVLDLDLPGRRKFREIVRSIKMVYDSIHVMAMKVDVHNERIDL